MADAAQDRGTPIRLGLFYATLYISTGASAPYMSLWFKARGLSGGAIGAILALPLLARVLTGRRWRSGPTGSGFGARRSC